MRLRGSTIVITGASSGIGAAAALQLGTAGAHVHLLARREDRLSEVADRIASAGGSARVHAVDLTDDTATRTMVQDILDERGTVDVLINNAGRSIRRPIAQSVDRLHDYERAMAINYLAPVRLTQALLPSMLAAGHGHIVFSSTMSTQLPTPLFSAYVASKAALESYATSLNVELGAQGISTTVVHFPLVRTEMSGATPIYASAPMMSADRAGGWLVRAARRRPTRVTTVSGALTQAGMAVAPGTAARIGRPMFKAFDARLSRRSRVVDPARPDHSSERTDS